MRLSVSRYDRFLFREQVVLVRTGRKNSPVRPNPTCSRVL